MGNLMPTRAYQNKLLKRFFILALLLCSPHSILPLLAASNPAQCLLASVTGPVTVAGPGSQPTRSAQEGTVLAEGERVFTSKNASAVLKFFDGSRIALGPDTDFSITRLRKLPNLGKIMRFKMALGKLLAQAAKLGSSKSAFEIEAGGVVCGVRGTEFTMDYEPASGKLDLRVSEGSVYAKAGGTNRVLNAGEELQFIKGKPGEVTKSVGSADGSKTGTQKPLGFSDPVFVDLHKQFMGGVQTYNAHAFDDPQAGGLQYRLNPPPAAGPNRGIIYATP